MLLSISAKDQRYHQLACLTRLLIGKFAENKAGLFLGSILIVCLTIFLGKEPDKGCRVEVFEHTAVIVRHSEVMARVDKKDIVSSKMSSIVRKGSQEHCHVAIKWQLT